MFNREKITSKERNYKYVKTGKQFKDKLEKWGEGVNLVSYCTKWDNMNGSERLKELKSFGTHEEFVLEKLVENCTAKSQVGFLQLEEPDSKTNFKRLSKFHLKQEIVNRFYERTGDLEKRRLKEMNLELYDEDENTNQDFKFLVLCDIQIPVDILRHIFSFFYYDSSMLFSLGRVSKVFYVTILTSWPHVTIRKRNVFKISLLVLRSVRSVTFDVPLTTGNSFLNKELDYILERLNPNRLHTVTINSLVYSFGKTLRHFAKKLKPDGTFRNVRVLRYDSSRFMDRSYNISMFNRKKDYTEYFRLLKIKDLSVAFPSLERVENPLVFNFLSKCSRLRSLSIHLGIPFRFDRNIDKVSGKIGIISEKKRDTGIPKNQIEYMKIEIHRDDGKRMKKLADFLRSGFTNLRHLKIEVTRKFYDLGGGSDQLQFTECFKSLGDTLVRLDFDSFTKYGYSKSPKQNTSALFICPIVSVGFSQLKILDFSHMRSNFRDKFGYRYSSRDSTWWVYSFQELINCMCLPSLSVLRIGVKTDSKSERDDMYHTQILEKLNERLPTMEELVLGISISFTVNTNVGRGDTEEKKDLKVLLEYSFKKKEFNFVTYSKTDYFYFPYLRNCSRQCSFSRLDVEDIPLLSIFLTQIPGILSKEEELWNSGIKTFFLDRAGHVFCKYNKSWTQIRNKEYHAGKKFPPEEIRYTKNEEEISKKRVVVESGKSCSDIFRRAMEGENLFECKEGEFTFSLYVGPFDLLEFTRKK